MSEWVESVQILHRGLIQRNPYALVIKTNETTRNDLAYHATTTSLLITTCTLRDGGFYQPQIAAHSPSEEPRRWSKPLHQSLRRAQAVTQ